MSAQPERLLVGDPTDRELTNQLIAPIRRASGAHRLLLWLTGFGALGGMTAYLYAVFTGIGTFGNNIPVAWAFPIINFVWWIGIGHAGTFISAILLLSEQKWRTSINRLAESMTIFALIQAGLFPILHLGRAWFFYWLVPYPSTMEVWPQFISVLTWDIAAITTYFTVTLYFWYSALIPDLATMRDRVRRGFARWAFGIFSLGWRGSARDWNHYRSIQLMLAGLATPLVLSVHSIVSIDFAMSQLPGWHATVWPPYFVAGAIFSGFAMVIQLVIPTRKLLRLENVITTRHLDLMGKFVLITGLIVTYTYIIETYFAWYSANEFEQHMLLKSRPFGTYAAWFWLMIFCNAVVIQTLWSRRVRTSPVALFVVATLVQIGMWLERFVIIVSTLHEDFLPSSWDIYLPSMVDVAILFGTISLFLFLYLLLIRFVPFVPVAELREMRHELHAEGRKDG